MNQQLIDAIRDHNIVEFDYGGHHRIAEPHVYGRHNETEQLLVYQVGGGSSSGGLPQWRRVDVAKMSGLQVSDDTFSGPRPTESGEHPKWDQTYAIVE